MWHNDDISCLIIITLCKLQQAAQVNDPKKYSVATALVHVVSENLFPPFFNKTVYKGFLIESSSPATLVTTYGNQVLVVQAIDRDFKDVEWKHFLYRKHLTKIVCKPSFWVFSLFFPHCFAGNKPKNPLHNATLDG